MNKPILSVLVPGVPRRFQLGVDLLNELNKQINKFKLGETVELLWLVDNYHRTVGQKRQALVDIAQGDYVIFMDDDDRPTDDYLIELVNACKKGPDVVTFWCDTTWNKLRGITEFHLDAKQNDQFNPPAKCIRKPWHICAWKSEIAKQCTFPNLNWGEDVPWVEQATPLAKTEVHIAKVLHIYNHQDGASESMAVSNKRP